MSKTTKSLAIEKLTLKQIYKSLNSFQKSLLEEIWQHFQPKGQWPTVRKLYSIHGRQKVRDALSSIKGKGNIGLEESGSTGRTEYRLLLLGVLLTEDQKNLYLLIKRFFEFQRNLFLKEPETTHVIAARIAQELQLRPEETQLLGQLLYVAQAGGSQVPSESWGINAMEEIESFPPTGDLSAQIDKWIFRYFKSDAPVFQDQRVMKHFTSVGNLTVNPQKNEIETTPKTSYLPNTAFIMMWMDKSQPELDDVLNAIKEVCSQFGIKAIRADEVEHEEKITDIILKQIRESQFLIAVLTGERPNVYYEVGYAHSLGKNPILYCKNPTSLHFDLAGYNVPSYENVTALKKTFKKAS